MKTIHKILLASVAAIAVVGLTSRDTPQQKEAKYLQRGNDLFAAGEYEKARVEYRNAAKLMPIDPEISFRWGMVDEAQGNIRNAYANYLRAEQQSPRYAPALLKIAHYQLVIEQYEDVKKRLDIVLADDPDNAEAHAITASVRLHLNDLENARKEAEFALSKDPANTTAFSVLTGLYLAKGDLKNAEASIDAGIAKNPTDLSLLLLKVRMFEKPLNLEKINATYQEIIKLQPGDVQLRTVLADIYMQAGKKDEAETAMRNAVRDLPDDWNMKYRLVTFLGQYRGTEIAEKEIQSYMQAYPDHSELYFWLAELYINHNETDKAVALLQQIVSKDDSDRQSLRARTSLARISFHKGEKEIAMKLVAAVLEKAPTNSDALFVRASVSTDDGQYQSAVSDLRLIIRDNPKNKDALQLLAEVLLLQGYTDLAIETLNQLVEIDPRNTPSQVRLAQMYNENHDPKRAMRILDIATKTDPGYPVAWEATARVAIGMKDLDAAKAAIAKLQTFKGQETVADFLNGQIAAAGGNPDIASATYTKIIEKDPTSPLAERAVFEMVEQHHTPEELTKTVAYLAGLKTDSPYINTIIGETYMTLDKADIAIPYLDKAIEAKPPQQDPYLNRAKLYMAKGDMDTTITLLQAARKANTADIRADLMLAGIYTGQEKYTDAIDLYEDVLSRFPDMDMPANNLAAIISDHEYTDTAMLDKAAKAAERFAGGKNPAFLDTLSWVYYRQGKFTQAQSTLSRVMAINEGINPEIHYHYGAILLETTNKVKAKDELTKATAPDSPPDVVQKARDLLKKI